MSSAKCLKHVNCSKKHPISTGSFICEDFGEKKIGPVNVITGLTEVEYDYSKSLLTKEGLEINTDRTIP